MATFAVLEVVDMEIPSDMVGTPYTVINLITADSLEHAEELTGKKCKQYLNPHRVGIGFDYNEQQDIYVPPKPYDDWVLDGELWRWVPPVPRPKGENEMWIPGLEWNQETKQWVEETPTE